MPALRDAPGWGSTAQVLVAEFCGPEFDVLLYLNAEQRLEWWRQWCIRKGYREDMAASYMQMDDAVMQDVCDELDRSLASAAKPR